MVDRRVRSVTSSRLSGFKHASVYRDSLETLVELHALAAAGLLLPSGVPDISRVYRILSYGESQEDHNVLYDLSLCRHRVARRRGKAPASTEHICMQHQCRLVAPVVPVGREELLVHFINWWPHRPGDGLNDGVILCQASFDAQQEITASGLSMELLTSYEQILAIFPGYVEGPTLYTP